MSEDGGTSRRDGRAARSRSVVSSILSQRPSCSCSCSSCWVVTRAWTNPESFLVLDSFHFDNSDALPPFRRSCSSSSSDCLVALTVLVRRRTCRRRLRRESLKARSGTIEGGLLALRLRISTRRRRRRRPGFDELVRSILDILLLLSCCSPLPPWKLIRPTTFLDPKEQENKRRKKQGQKTFV